MAKKNGILASKWQLFRCKTADKAAEELEKSHRKCEAILVDAVLKVQKAEEEFRATQQRYAKEGARDTEPREIHIGAMRARMEWVRSQLKFDN